MCRGAVPQFDKRGRETVVEGYDPGELVGRWGKFEEVDRISGVSKRDKEELKRIINGDSSPSVEDAIAELERRKRERKALLADVPPEVITARDTAVATCTFELRQPQKQHEEGTQQLEISERQRGRKPSCFNCSEGAIRELIKLHAGHGVPELTNKGEWSSKETCAADHVIGVVYNKAGKPVETRCFKIHYGATKVHTVPRYDDGRVPDEV